MRLAFLRTLRKSDQEVLLGGEHRPLWSRMLNNDDAIWVYGVVRFVFFCRWAHTAVSLSINIIPVRMTNHEKHTDNFPGGFSWNGISYELHQFRT